MMERYDPNKVNETTKEWRNKLKPCPFCGGEAELVFSNDNHLQPYVKCRYGSFLPVKCPNSKMYQWNYYSIDDAVGAWNNRAKEEKCKECANMERMNTRVGTVYYCKSWARATTPDDWCSRYKSSTCVEADNNDDSAV